MNEPRKAAGNRNSVFRQPEMIVAMAAIVLSICGLFFALYEASIARMQDILDRSRVTDRSDFEEADTDCKAVPQSAI